jgi:ribosomal protein L40E
MCAPSSGETAEEFYNSISWKDVCPHCGARLPIGYKLACPWCNKEVTQ